MYGHYPEEQPQKISSKNSYWFKSYEPKTEKWHILCSKMGHIWDPFSLRGASGCKNDQLEVKLLSLVYSKIVTKQITKENKKNGP